MSCVPTSLHVRSSRPRKRMDFLWKNLDFPEVKRTNSSRRSADESYVDDRMDALYKLDLQDDYPMFYLSSKGYRETPQI